MAQAYIRQSNFADGDTITAALFNDEYNQLVNAFAYSSSSVSSTGHRHDGTAGEGGNIFKIGDLDFLNKVEIDSTNNRIGFYTEVSSAAVEQLRIQDGALVPVTDSDIDLGTTSLRFKDTFTDSITTTGNVSVGGNLTVTGTTTFNGGTITMGDADTDNVVFGANVDSSIIPDDDNTHDLGSSSQQWRNLYVDGTAYVDSINLNEATITATATELNLLDGVTATTAELNYVDVTTAGTVEASKAVVADSNADVLFSDNDKLKFGTSSDLQIYHDGSNSYIKEDGTGNLIIAADDFRVTNVDVSEVMIGADTDGVVSLYHNGSIKLGTTSSGISVTGNVSLSGNIVQSSDLLIDAGGDIFLDADGGDIKFKDAGTTFVEITNSSTDAVIKSTVSDKDIIFKGNDGGSTITALTLDMSNAGAATFNSNVTINGADIDIASIIRHLGDTDTFIGFPSADTFRIVTGNSEALRVNSSQHLLVGKTDNSFTTDGTEIRGGNLGARVIRSNAEPLTLHRQGTDGTILALYSASTEVGSLSSSSDNFVVASTVSDKDILFQGNDGGSTITALTLDMSAGGKAVFASNIDFGDGHFIGNDSDDNLYIASSATEDIRLDSAGNIILDADGGEFKFLDGGAENLVIGKTGSAPYLYPTAQDSDFKILGNDGGSQITALTLDMSDAGTATFNHDVKLGDNGRVKFGDGGDMSIFHNATDTFIQNATGSLIIENTLDDSDIVLKSDNGSGGTAAYITLDGSAALTQFDKDTKHVDSIKATFGNSADLEIHHDSNNSKITHTGTGGLYIGADTFALQNGTHDENFIVMSDNGAVLLYHDGSYKLATDSSGVDIQGLLDVSSKVAVAGGTEATSTDGSIRTEGGISAAKKIYAGTDITLGGDLIHAGEFKIDVGADLTLDAGGADIILSDDGTIFGTISRNSGMQLRVRENDQDMHFRGVDSGTEFTALTLDMSEAGNASFNADVTVGGNLTVQGTTVTLNTATLDVEDKNITLNAGSGDTSGSADGAGITIQDAVDASTDASLTWRASDDKFIFSHKLRMFDDLELPDSVKLIAGDGNDLEIYHDGNDSYVKDGGTGNLRIISNGAGVEINKNTTEYMIRALTDGAVELYNDNSLKLATASDGIDINGASSTTFGLNIIDPTATTYGAHFSFDDTNAKVLIGGVTDGTKNAAISITRDTTQVDFGTHITLPDNGRIKLGQASDLQLYHDGSNSFINETGTGNLKILADSLHIKNASDDELKAYFDTNGGVGLYHDNVQKFVTTSTGISVTGNVALTGDIQKTGQITLDASTDIALDTDTGIILLKDGGTNKGRITTASDIISIVNSTQDGDIKFDGLDGSSSITALRLDMSEGGSATFNKDILLSDDSALRLGTGQDLALFHDGTNSFIRNNTGILNIKNDDIRFKTSGDETSLRAVANGAVELMYDNSTKIATNSGGVTVTGTVAGDVVSAHTTENTVANDDVIAFYDTSASAIRKTAVSNLPGGSGSSAADDITTGDAAVTIGTSSGNITLDTPSDIHLDVGGQIKLDLNGTLYGNIFNTSNNLGIHVAQQDKDLIISGNDNGNSINALTIDMSSSGDAIFNNDVNAAGSVIAQTKLAVGVTAVHASYGFYNQNNAYFNGGVTIDDNLSITAGSISITGDGSNATTLTESGSGDFTIDTVGDIIFDADGGDITFKDAGTSIGKVAINNSGFFDIVSEVSDNDIRLRGNDGGSTITALTLDMSEAGAATFNNNVTAFSDERLKDNIETLEDGLDKVKQLRGVTYTRDDREEIGVIAQEVEKILPEIVLTANDEMGTKSVDYSRITAVLIEAVKELSARVKELENK